MKLIAITGHKNSGKDWLARKLAENSDVIYVRPYTDQEMHEEFITLNSSQLSYKMEREEVLLCKEIRKTRYVIFKSQLRADFCVIIVTPDMIKPLKDEYGFDLFSIYCHTGQGCEDPSKYNYVFNTNEDSYENLEERVEYD